VLFEVGRVWVVGIWWIRGIMDMFC